MPTIPRFADLLTAAVHRIKALEGKPLTLIHDELGYALGRERGGSVIEYWRKGNIPSSLSDLEALCQILRQRTDFDLPWFQVFLRAASHPYATLACQRLFTGATDMRLRRTAVRPPVGDFVGRDWERSHIVTLLTQPSRTGHVLALRGMGGLGKTELAYAVAHCLSDVFPDSIVAVSMGGTSRTPLSPPQALQAVLGILAPDAGVSNDLTDLEAHYHGILTSRRVLVIADDVADAAQVRCLIPAAGSALLMTTRHRFHLPGLTSIDLDTLSPTASHRLLLAICPRLDQQAAEVARLCGYLPLALRVSASLLMNDDTYPVADYLSQLADERTRLQHLRDPEDTSLDVEASLNLSFAALTPVEQTALSQLGVFPATFDGRAAEAVVAVDPESVRSVLNRLRRQNLLAYDQHLDRYWLHDLIRALARRALPAHDPAWQRVARYSIEYAIQANLRYRKGGPEELAALADFDREAVNIRHAWGWLATQSPSPMIDQWVLDLVTRTAGIGVRFSVADELIPMLLRGQAAAERLENRNGLMNCTGNLGQAYLKTGRTSEARSCFDQVLTLARMDSNQAAEAGAIASLAGTLVLQGDLRQAEVAFKQGLDLARASGNHLAEGAALGNLGYLYMRKGELTRAIAVLEQSLALSRERGLTSGEVWDCGMLGMACAAVGDMLRAGGLVQHGLALARQLANEDLIMQLLAYHGWVSLCQCAWDAAEALLHEARALAQRHRDQVMESWVLGKLSILAWDRGAFEESRALFARARALDSDDEWAMASDSWRLGRRIAEAGDIEAAMPLLNRWIAYQAQVGHVDQDRDRAYVLSLTAPPMPPPHTSHDLPQGDLTDAEWERIQAVLPQKPRTGRPSRDHRIVINGILWVLRRGVPWRAVPARYGNVGTISSRYYRWHRAGVWDRILAALQSASTGHDERSRG